MDGRVGTLYPQFCVSVASFMTNGKNRKAQRGPEAKSIKQLLAFRLEATNQPADI